MQLTCLLQIARRSVYFHAPPLLPRAAFWVCSLAITLSAFIRLTCLLQIAHSSVYFHTPPSLLPHTTSSTFQTNTSNMNEEVGARRPRKDKHAPTYSFKETVEKVLVRVCDKLEKLLTTSPEEPMLLFGAAAHPLMFITEVVSNCGESVIEHLTGDQKAQAQLIDVIFSWFGKIAHGGQYPLLDQHLDLWKAIKAQRRDDIKRIQSETPEYITVHLVKIDRTQQDIYQGKLVSFDGSTSTTEDPVMNTDLWDHHLVLDGHSEHNKIDIHAVIDRNTIPHDLYQKIDHKTNRLRFTDLQSLDWLESVWLLVLSIYGAMDTTLERSQEVIRLIQTQLDVRSKSNRSNKTQLGRSVSIAQAHPNQRGFVDAPRNIPGRRGKDPGAGLAIPLNEHTPTVRGIWAYALNSLEGIVPTLVKHWRKELFEAGYHLQGASAFVACGYVLQGYAATAHVDQFDPHFTAGFRLARFDHELAGDNQLFFPELVNIDTEQTGVVVQQTAGTITLYQGGHLMHTNSITDQSNQSKLCAPGIALVQKQQLTSKTFGKNEQLLAQQPKNWKLLKDQWQFRQWI
jgi:hypothetical protein